MTWLMINERQKQFKWLNKNKIYYVGYHILLCQENIREIYWLQIIKKNYYVNYINL